MPRIAAFQSQDNMNRIIILVLLVLTACNKPANPNSTITWECICNTGWDIPATYRARVYGGWLVKNGKAMVFMPSNNPDNWIIENTK
jgi:hypothetical protein